VRWFGKEAVFKLFELFELRIEVKFFVNNSLNASVCNTTNRIPKVLHVQKSQSFLTRPRSDIREIIMMSSESKLLVLIYQVIMLKFLYFLSVEGCQLSEDPLLAREQGIEGNGPFP